MKKIINTLMLCAVLLASVGCERPLLDKIAYDSLPGDYVLETEEGLEKMLSGCYDVLQSKNWYGGVL
jgi:hypothetical protein